MNKVYYIGSCSTCQRVLEELKLPGDFEYQDLKINNITEEELDFLKEEVGRYELLFNKRARLYRENKLKEKSLNEQDYKKLILEHYSFLRRPLFVIDNKVIVGNATKIIKEIRKYFEK